ncbi:MAG: RodZ domain-containing protein [Pseudomonadota bacterium]
MSDEEAPAEEAQGPSCGERLRDARRELQISVDEIAKELHIDEGKVRALEANDFDTLGAPVFAKGHLRKYAQLVKVDEADIFAEYHALTHKDGLPQVVPNRRRPTLPKSPAPLLALTAVVIVVVAVAAAGYWFFLRSDTSAPTALPASPDVALPGTGAAADVSLLPDATATVASELDAASEPDDTPAAQPNEPPPAIDEADDLLQIRLAFSGDCWTEMTDSSGQRLFFDLGEAGRTVDLSGEAPVSVLLGNASNVDISVNGNRYNIDAADRRGETARFTLYQN